MTRKPDVVLAILLYALAALPPCAVPESAAQAATLPGRIPGEFLASPTGAATYSIPIASAQGMNGLRPTVALAYSSHAGDGLAGTGWVLSGFSEIRRCGLTPAVDGKARGVRFDRADRFCLDGQPLILVSGSYGSAGAEYRTEVHDYERVFSYGQQGSGPAWFEVRHPDGSSYRYGNDADSRIEAPGSGEVHTWALNEVADRFQQTIGYHYGEDEAAAEHYPLEIRWTYGPGETAAQARARLVFGYEPRPAGESRTGFVWGSPWQLSRRLVTIDHEFSHSAGTFSRIHRYTLGYAGTGNRLASMTLCGPRDCLAPTVFEWDEAAPGWGSSWVRLQAPGEGSLFGDFDGNGTADLFGNQNGKWAVWPADPVSGASGAPIPLGATFSLSGAGIVMEVNGDGYADLLARSSATGSWIAWLSPGPSGGAVTMRNTGFGTSGASLPIALDIDADGLDDLVYLRSGKAYLRRNLGGTFSAELPAGIGSARAPWVAVQGSAGWLNSADFDGDGREDLLVARSRDSSGKLVWEAFLANGSGFDATPISVPGSTANAEDIVVLDLNGDGLSDVARAEAGRWITYISRGTASGTTSGLVATACSDPASALSAHKATAVDYDGDGRADLLFAGGNDWLVVPSDGACFAWSERIDIGGPEAWQAPRVVAVDRDGDGLPDLLFASPFSSGHEWSVMHHQRGTRPDGAPMWRAGLLREVRDGLGNSHEFVYRTLADGTGYSLRPGTAPAGSRLIAGSPLAVLGEYRADAGNGSRQSLSFAYANLRADGMGRGLLGFEFVTTVDSRDGVTTETRYRQDFPFLGKIRSTTVRSAGGTLSAAEQIWQDQASAAPDPALDTHFVHVVADQQDEYETDRDGGYQGQRIRRVQRQLTWNYVHGGIATEQTTLSAPQDADMVYRTTRAVTFDEGPKASGCLRLPARIDVTRDRNGTAAQTRTTQFGHHATHCRLLTRTQGPPGSPAQQLRTSYAYDPLGRVETVTLADGAGLLVARQTRYTYAPGGSRPATQAQLIPGAPALTVATTWNEALGVELSRAGPDGEHRWTYDDFGRPTWHQAPPSERTRTSYGTCGPCFAPGARYTVRRVRADGLWSESQFDSRDRLVGRSMIMAGGRISQQIYEYDAMGRLARESVPFLDNAPTVYWTTYQYDILGRRKSVDQPVSEALPSGALTTYVYAGLDTTARGPEQQATTLTHDAEGRLTLIKPPLGTNTAYTYTVFGELSSIIDAGWNNTTFSYDMQGRLTASRHPDAGQRNFEYNAFGELIAQSDGKSPPNRVTLGYDPLGRITQRTEPEGTTLWTYIAAGAGQGRLAAVSGPGEDGPAGVRESYQYDGYGRLIRTTTRIDGTDYQTDYTYDSGNRLTSMTYPATVGWRPTFTFGYGNGHLVSITQSTMGPLPVYRLLATDAHGRETQARYGGTALEERNVFDAANSHLAAIQTGYVSGPPSLQNYAYEWSRSGNLVARRDQNQNPPAEERFAYDEIDRLTLATLNGATTLAVAYSADGNIRQKSDAGQYSYSQTGERPHAVTAVSGGPPGAMSFSYDANGNMTSRNGTTLSWTSFNQPRQITSASGYTRLTYGPNRMRIRRESRSGGTTAVTHYVGPHFEVEIQGGVRRYRANVFAHGRAVYSQVETSTGGLEGYYVLHDHIGSVDRLVRAAGSGADTLAQSFDVWGRRRNPDWSADPAGQRYADAHWIERGFTGHEHLDAERLLLMNGRLEDPLLGRMLSPDPVLGALSTPQNLNPYSYVANNPATFADPSGLFLSKLRKVLKRGIRHLGSTSRRIVRRWGRQIGAVAAAYFAPALISSWAYLPADASALVGGMAAGAVQRGGLPSIIGGGLTAGWMHGFDVEFGGRYSIQRVLAEGSFGGVMSVIQGGKFVNGFATSGGLSSLTWASLEMRDAMIEQSLKNPKNASGKSDGFRGDQFKLGGCRHPCKGSPLGGIQGEQGQFFGLDYESGSFLDHLIETYAGPHDFLNNPIFYRNNGNARSGFFGDEIFNVANVAIATPFAMASIVPTSAYGSLYDD